jgi:hypothetical protein
MRWLRSDLPEHIGGKSRKRTVFAWLPMRVGIEWVWLERVAIYEQLTRRTRFEGDKKVAQWRFWEELRREVVE